MQGTAEFTITGLVGRISEFDNVTKVSIASDYPSKDEEGAWHDHTHWNTVTVFSEGSIRWIKDHLNAGDLVAAKGRLRETSYEKNGAKVYSVDLNAQRLDRLATKEQLASTRGTADEIDQAA